MGGEFAATACKDRTIWIWDLRKGKDGNFEKPMNFNKGMQYHNGQISSIAFGGVNGTQLLSCGHGATMILWTAPKERKSMCAWSMLSLAASKRRYSPMKLPSAQLAPIAPFDSSMLLLLPKNRTVVLYRFCVL